MNLLNLIFNYILTLLLTIAVFQVSYWMQILLLKKKNFRYWKKYTGYAWFLQSHSLKSLYPEYRCDISTSSILVNDSVT